MAINNSFLLVVAGMTIKVSHKMASGARNALLYGGIFILLWSTGSFAEGIHGGIELVTTKIRVTDGIALWRQEIDRRGRELIKANSGLGPTGLIECREAEEIPAAYLCLSFFQYDLNRLFGRASIFAEGGYELGRGSLANESHPDMAKLNLTTQGHDLKSSDLLTFFKMSETSWNPYEKKFHDNVLLKLKKRHGKFVVLGFSYQAFDSYQSIVGHEVMHAQYLLQPQYAKTVANFWGTLSADERSAIRSALKEEAYDPADEELMKNEFQAFVLEPDAETDRLAKFAQRYRVRLMNLLQQARIAPVQIH
jgi:hypothetical protein